MSTIEEHLTREHPRMLPFYGLSLICVIGFGFWTLWEPFGRDQGIHATIAAALLEGQVTYRDVFNMKPPMTTAFHAASQLVFGHDVQSIRILDMAFFAVTLVALASLLMRLGLSRTAAAVAMVVTSSIYYRLDFWNRSQTDGWAAFLLIFAMLCLVIAWKEDRARMAYLAGVLMGLAFALKYTIGAIGLVAFAPLLVQGMAPRLADTGRVILGGAATLVAFLMVLWSFGALDQYLEIQRLTLDYGKDLRVPLTELWQWIPHILAPNWLFAGAMAATVALAFRRDLAGLVLTFWLIAGIASFWSQGKGFAYHGWLMILAITAGTAFLVDLVRGLFPSRGDAARLVTALCITVFAVMNGSQARTVDVVTILAGGDTPTAMPREIEGGDFSASDNERAAALLSARMAPEETLFVWGFETGLYFMTERTPRHFLPYTWPLQVTVEDGQLGADLLARLKAAPPDWVAVQSGDATPKVSGRDVDSATLLDDYPDIRAFFDESYREEARTERFSLRRRVAD